MRRSDIDALARLLDGDPTLNGEATPEVRALGALAVAIEARAVAPRATFRADLRTSLLEEARAQADERPAPSALTRWRDRLTDSAARWRYAMRTAVAAVAAAMALSTGGVALAAQRALPGELLYPLKLAMEDVRVWALRDIQARGSQQLRYAGDRISEAYTAAGLGNATAAARALTEADVTARAGASDLLTVFVDTGDEAALSELRTFAEVQHVRVTDLTRVVDEPASSAAVGLLISLERIGDRTGVLDDGCEPATSDGPAGAALTVIPAPSRPFDRCPGEDPTAQVLPNVLDEANAVLLSTAPGSSADRLPDQTPGGPSVSRNAPRRPGREAAKPSSGTDADDLSETASDAASVRGAGPPGTSHGGDAALRDDTGTVGGTTGAVEETGEGGGDAVEGPTDPVTSKTTDTVEKTTDAVEKTTDAVDQTTDAVDDQTGGALGDLTDPVKGELDDTEQELEEVVEETTTEAVDDTINDLQSEAESLP